ncbi:beta-barrel assembly-enhancing protease [mine drainage metagenome]|uniref:Beta-barrel assembly-enhancing protease n=1 Tax=mine drainage metagenome TaxID=410659 RepID=A0A1J5SJR8_9ZZZZ
MTNEPDGIDQLFQQAVLRHQAGDLEGAVGTYRLVLTLRPQAAVAAVNLSIALQGLNRAAEAERALRDALAQNPALAEAENSLGCLLLEQNRLEEAEAAFRRAAALAPGLADPANNLGNALRKAGRLAEAAQAFRLAAALAPDHPQPLSNLAACLLELGDRAGSIAACQTLLERHPEHDAARNCLGNALLLEGRLDEAEAAFRQAEDSAEAGVNLAGLLYDLERFDEATETARAVIARHPAFAPACNTLGNALLALGRLEDAEAAFRRGLDLAPKDAQMALNFAAVLLKQGRFREGWATYEARRLLPRLPPPWLPADLPPWTGAPLDKPLLVHAEQGLGDCLQFCRYAPALAERAGLEVVLQVPPELTRLLGGLSGDRVRVVGRNAPLPACAAHLPLMSLPGLMPDSFLPEPYLTADAGAVAAWRRRLAATPGRKVGLVWAGDPRPFSKIAHLLDRRRSMRREQLAPLAALPGLCLISLQKGAAAAQRGLELLDWTAELHDMADTAALVAALDLVISVDTAVAHLAGALGKPVWLLSRFDGCWRWQQGRDDSPWYPSLRLFRQSRHGDWAGVVQRVAEALAETP